MKTEINRQRCLKFELVFPAPNKNPHTFELICGSFCGGVSIPKGIRAYGENYRGHGRGILYTTPPEVGESDKTSPNPVELGVRAR